MLACERRKHERESKREKARGGGSRDECEKLLMFRKAISVIIM